MNSIFSTRCFCLLLTVAFIISCEESSENPGLPAPGPTTDLAIDPATAYQTIAGFGGANQMWGMQFPVAADIKSTFGMGET